jgi:hypothetical protein
VCGRFLGVHTIYCKGILRISIRARPPDDIIGDLLARQLGRPPFTWGQTNLVDVGKTRAQYVEALRAADKHDIGPILLFARS